jgi:hypothetical protein
MLVVRALALLLLLGPATALADGDRAQQLFGEGKAAYQRHDFPTAYERFKEAYVLSQRPEMLFNMASALREMGQPHRGAEVLRSYLQLEPNLPDRAELERVIANLEVSQRILDEQQQGSERVRVARRRRKVGLAAGLSAAGVVVLGGIALGLVFGLQPSGPPTLQATP